MEHTREEPKTKAAHHSCSIRMSRDPNGMYVAELRGIPSYRAEADSPDEAEMLLLEMLSEARGLGLHPRALVQIDADVVRYPDDAN